MLELLKEQLSLIIKGCACSSGCPLCEINRREAMSALEILEDFSKRFELVVVCKQCGELADTENHVCRGLCEL